MVKQTKAENIVTVVLSVILVLVLYRNFQYLYVTPASFFVKGDETWFMSQYREFVTTGHYINPTAPGSELFKHSGVLLNCYLTAAIYGAPTLLFDGNVIDIGKTVSFIVGLVMLASMWFLFELYNIKPWMRVFGCYVLSSTICYFDSSHCCRFDIITGLAIMLALFLRKNINPRLLGLLFPLSTLIGVHALILVTPLLIYLIVLSDHKVKAVTSAVSGFAILFVLQYLLLGSTSMAVNAANDQMPIFMIFHPRADMTIIASKIYAAKDDAAYALVIVFCSMIVFFLKRKSFPNREMTLIINTALCLCAYFFIEQKSYLIQVLPMCVFTVIVVLSKIDYRSYLLVAPLSIVMFLSYLSATRQIGDMGRKIAVEDEIFSKDAMDAIHKRNYRATVFSTISGQSTVINDKSCKFVTSVIYYKSYVSDPWKNANIDYAVVFSKDRAAEPMDNVWYDTSAKTILQDIEDNDTMRVYEFSH